MVNLLRFSEIDQTKFSELWRAGKTTRELMQVFNVQGRGTIITWAKQLNLPLRVNTWFGEGFGYCVQHQRQNATLFKNRAGMPKCPLCWRTLRLRPRNRKARNRKEKRKVFKQPLHIKAR